MLATARCRGLRARAADLPSCNGSIVWIISCSRPCRNLAPVAVWFWWIGTLPLLEPGGPDRLSEAALDVTEPPGCVAIDVSDELAALPCRGGRRGRNGTEQRVSHGSRLAGSWWGDGLSWNEVYVCEFVALQETTKLCDCLKCLKILNSMP